MAIVGNDGILKWIHDGNFFRLISPQSLLKMHLKKRFKNAKNELDALATLEKSTKKVW